MASKKGLAADKKTSDPDASNADSSGSGSDVPKKKGRGGPRGPRKPKTPPTRLPLLLSEEHTGRVRAVARAFSTTEEEVLARLEASYKGSSFEPHLAKLVDTYEAEEAARKEQRRAEIFGVPEQPIGNASLVNTEDGSFPEGAAAAEETGE